MIPYGRHHIDEADIQAVVDVLRRGELTQGPTVEAFERAVADYVGARYAVAVSSCTAGLHLAAMAAGVGPGTALVTSPITFVASANAALYCGAQPLFADIDAGTVNMSAASLRDTLQRHPNVRAVIPVHFGGLPCDMPAIHEVATGAGVVVIEDAAHAIGATYPDGTRVGCCAHSLMTVFSFHPVKAIASGEGGMITTNDAGVYRHLLRLRSHGINKLDDVLQAPEQSWTNGVRDPWYYEMQELGYHFRITDIQCALGLSQFGKLDRFLARRRALVRTYDAAFAGSQSLRPAQTTGREASGHHIYVARVDFDALGTTRHGVMAALRDKGIVTQVHYIPVPAHPHYRRLGFRPEDYPAAAEYYRQALTIPLYFDLTDQEQQLVINSLTALVS